MAGEPRGEEHREAGLIVEHYRLDASTSMRRALGLASLVVTAGALLMASAIVVSRHDGARATPVRDALFRAGEVTAEGAPVERPPGLELALGVAGLACIALGGASAIVGLRRVLTDESYLALCVRAARTSARERSVRWSSGEDVEAVRWDAEERAVRFERHDGSAWIPRGALRRHRRAEPRQRAAEVRRKALFGLLPGSRFSARGSRPPSPPRAGA
ncbi:MAG: hypothetical protein M5U28_43700 [Sandaracinaceae bacterium]|nr:hypothetical protein [Sandaracinaceae bacterium]